MRLHFAHYIHNAFHERNIVIQPGPLTKSPLHRSLATPSFRVVDFGRTFTWDDWLRQQRGSGEKKDGEEARGMGEKMIESLELDFISYFRSFEEKRLSEMKYTRKELGYDPVEVI